MGSKIFPIDQSHIENHPVFASNILNGDYDLTDTIPGKYRFSLVSPSTQNSLLYVQYISIGGKAGAQHYTKRQGLNSYLFALTREGSGKLVYRNKEYILNSGDCFFIDCREEHYYKANTNSGWAYDLIHMNGEPLSFLYSIFLSNECCSFSTSSNKKIEKLLFQIFDICEQHTRLAELQIHRYLTDLITELTETNLNSQYLTMPQKIISVCEYIEKNYQSNISLEDISAYTFLSKHHLCREFKKYTGKTIIEYLTLWRINKAKDLLITTDLSISEIAEFVGITNTNYFYNVFKKYEGSSPNEFRKKWI